MGDDIPDIPLDDVGDARRLTPAQAFRLFGLPPDADRERVRARYRRLAFLHHPDRNGGSPDSFARFRQISRAYGALNTWLRSTEAGAAFGACARCYRHGATHRGLDGRRLCRDCLTSAAGRRFLPLPPVVIASCAFAIVTLAWAVVFLTLFFVTHRAAYGVSAAVCSVAAVLFLGILSVVVGQVARPSRR